MQSLEAYEMLPDSQRVDQFADFKGLQGVGVESLAYVVVVAPRRCMPQAVPEADGGSEKQEGGLRNR